MTPREPQGAWTPGPWRDGPPAWFRGRCNDSDGKRPINSMQPGHPIIANVYGEANARLIAATPDLFEALTKAAAQFEFYAGQHAAKGTVEADAKAHVNHMLAAEFRAILARAAGENAMSGDWEGVMAEIAAERQRQIAKGYDAAHDDQHTNNEIVWAEAWGAQTVLQEAMETIPGRPRQRKLLVQVAAMIIAEIERLDRTTLAATGATPNAR